MQDSGEKSPNPTHGFVIIAIALLTLLSLISFTEGHSRDNILGMTGYTIAWLLISAFGWGSFFIPAFAIWWGIRFVLRRSVSHPAHKIIWFSIGLISACILLNQLETHSDTVRTFFKHSIQKERPPVLRWLPRDMNHHLGGIPLYTIYRDIKTYNLVTAFNESGIAIIFGALFLASIAVLFKIRLSHFRSLFDMVKKNLSFVEIKGLLDWAKDRQWLSKAESPEVVEVSAPTPLVRAPTPPPAKKTESRADPIPKPPPRDAKPARDYSAPEKSLLTSSKKVDRSQLKKILERQAMTLEETLLSFGIEAKVGEINCGPRITSFEVHPAVGVKVQKIKTLENDIALNMKAESIRIIAPIPGKAAVGIEVPNPEPQEVSFKDLLQTYQSGSKKFHIPMLLGKAVNGDNVMADLAKMPHCIIAGATGSGKSVCINTIVMSIVMNAKPEEIRLLMVDPKKVELTPYTKLPHMLAPVITEPQEACTALNWLVREMEKRYEVLKVTGQRNIEGFNRRKINPAEEAESPIDIPEKFAYYVGIIDELADLMMVSTHDIETPIARIAQMARAVGIHLILATQRPSREVITGLIKANFPTRISFKVASRVNSQIVLDESGAEQLLGNGDALFLPPGSSTLVRTQGAFIRDEDIARVIQKITAQAPPNYLIDSFGALEIEEAKSAPDPSLDTLYSQAKDIVVSTGQASTTFLQRKLKVGYARAASIMDQLEDQGVVGPAEGSKPRQILKKG